MDKVTTDKLIEPEVVLRLLGLKETSSALFLPPYKDAIKPKAHGLYSYKEVLNYIEIKEAKHTFLCMIQSLVLFMLDKVESKRDFAKHLGFKELPYLDRFLDARIVSDKTAKIFVKCCSYRKSLVYEFDRYMYES